MTNLNQIWGKWLEKQSKEHKQIIEYYTNLILNVDQRVYPRMSYGVCFLYRFGPIAYFNLDKQGLYFAFYWGKLLLNVEGSEILTIDEKKMVKRVYLNSLKEDESFIGTFLLLLESAMLVDEKKYGSKRR